ncbi:MAG: hypothetical protein NZ528_09695 [Caldilineales bacterium]|nr:hypothetical protein [Caldilineales bacterium]MDW8317914.1 hypothetical protein [Anaerolineae bacterium]
MRASTSKIVWEYDPAGRKPQILTAEDARKRLEAGNRAFAGLRQQPEGGTPQVVHLSPADLGVADEPGRAPAQAPFAVMLGCADARGRGRWPTRRPTGQPSTP